MLRLISEIYDFLPLIDILHNFFRFESFIQFKAAQTSHNNYQMDPFDPYLMPYIKRNRGFSVIFFKNYVT